MPSSGDFCVICNTKWNIGSDFIEIFQNECAETDQHIVELVAKLLNKNIKPDPNTRQFICQKCFQLITELEELQTRVAEIKSEILIVHADQDQDGDDRLSDIRIVKQEFDSEGDEGGEVEKKLLFIPTSEDDDDDSAHAQMCSDDKSSFHDINIELARMEGVDIESEIEHQEKENDDMEIEYRHYSGEDEDSADADTVVIDSGALEHSSDSDYDPNTIKSTGYVEIPLNDKEIHLKMSSTNNDQHQQLQQQQQHGPKSADKKPIILRKKNQSSSIHIDSESKKSDSENGATASSSIAIPIVSKENNLYTCLLCEGDETVAGESKAIVAHVKQAHNVRLYICDVCGRDFCKRNQLSAHLDEHVAAEEGDFQCEVCNRIFNNLRLFRIHKRMHYPQSKAWVCDTCGKKYSSKKLLEEHVNTHLGVRPYACTMCNKTFASKYTYKAHEKTHEVRPRPYKCTQCDKSFLSQQNLTQHERTHLELKEYACQLCGKQFGTAHNLEVHSIVHTGYKPFVCGLCGKAFARKAEIRDHERTHTGERPYQCELCGATFSQRSNLQSHKRATHYDDKRYQCSICDKGFKRRRLLDYHIKAAHTGERPYKCETCESTFVYPEHFKKHKRIHTGEKPFLCEVCGKAFNSRDNRNAHRFVHSDKKPYECLVCGAGFMRKPLLYQHMQSQGHLNDTIVVNQPRLTTDVVTVNASDVTGILDEDGNEHIIIDGHQLSFAEVASEEEENEEIIDEIEQVVTEHTDDEFEEVITSDVLANGETQIIETPDGPVQLVKVRIPNENGEEEEAWIKIVPE